MNKNTSLGEGCGYDHWQLQIIDKVDEGQPGQLGKRSANLCRQITVAENNFNKKNTFLTPTTLQRGVLAKGTVHGGKPRTKFQRGTNLI